MTWYPKETDLSWLTGRALEEAYRNRERARCSRDDFADGFMAALRYLNAGSSFKTGRVGPADEPTDG